MLVKLENISKAYPGVQALENVDFSLEKGEVRALLGKNGAGKSTLIKILAGSELPDSGDMMIDDEPTKFRTPSDGIKAGIATVYQELSIIPELTITENIFLGQWMRNRWGVDWKSMNAETRSVLQNIGMNLAPETVANAISVAQKQIVEIARALHRGAKILILDEPTSSLVHEEVESLMKIVKTVSAQGVGVIYISHRMDEIRRIADSVTVMRDGKHILTQSIDAISDEGIVEAMVGAQIASTPLARPIRPMNAQPVVFSCKNLQIEPKLRNVNFDLKQGEILGIAGVLGSGRTELLEAIFGVRKISGGAMVLKGESYAPNTIRRAMANGVFLTPEDRRAEGAVMMLSIGENMVMASWDRVSSVGVIAKSKMTKLVDDLVARLGVKLASQNEPLSNLSGGNQQKVVIGKALSTRPTILLLDEPTRGVDVEAKLQIYRIMRELADEGMAIVFVSGELEEFVDVCDRVIILRNGQMEMGFDGQEITTNRLLNATLGEEAKGDQFYAK